MLPWLSSWLFHPLLAAGTAAVASPILIHLLSRRRFRRVRWAAIEFLLKAYQQNRRRVRMEQLILLAVRCLAVLLLALAFARPFLRPGAAAAILGSAPRTERIVVLDDSFSMGYRDAGRSVFENGVAAAQRLAAWIGAEMPDDSFTLILTSRVREPLVAVPNLSETHLQKLDSELRGLSPSEMPARPGAALAAVADLLASRPTQANAAVYLISDFQRVDWANGEAPKRPTDDSAKQTDIASTQPGQSGPEAVAALTRSARSMRLVMIDVSAEQPRNVAIVDVRPLANQVVAGAPIRLAVDVANYTNIELRDLELSLSLADHALPPVLVARVPAGQVVSEPVEVAFPRAGSDYINVSLSEGGGGLSLDNRRAWSGTVEEAVRLLIVDGEPSSDNYKDEAYLLKTALRPEGRSFSGNDVRVVDETELDGLDLTPFHAVILTNLYRLSESARQALERFVADGGGLAVYAGGQLDVEHYNDALFAGGRGLLPGAVGDARGAPATMVEGALQLADWDEGHPLFRSFAGPPSELLRRIRFNRFIPMTMDQGSQFPVPSSREGTPQSQPSRSPAAVVASVNDEARSALIVERQYKKGNVVWIGSTADLDWNDWARDPSYVPFVLQLAAYLARAQPNSGGSPVGEPLRCALDPNQYVPKVHLQLPGDSLEAPMALDARPSVAGGFVATWNDTRRSGIYRFDLKRPGGETDSRYQAVNADARESDLTPAGREGLLRALPDTKFEYIRDLASVANASTESRRELWWPLLMIAAALLITEHVLAWRFGRT